jgi:hypothetical protein
LFSGSIPELEFKSFKYSTRIVTGYFGKIETKPGLILERATLISLLYITG